MGLVGNRVIGKCGNVMTDVSTLTLLACFSLFSWLDVDAHLNRRYVYLSLSLELQAPMPILKPRVR